jgi:hypothetical protein
LGRLRGKVCPLEKRGMNRMTAVTRVTGQATRDDLADQDYRDIYDEVRSNKSLDQFVALAGSQYSKAWWSKYERRQVQLTRPARNELRRLMHLVELAPTVGDALVDVNPDAEVWRVGELQPDRVILVGIEHAGPALLLRVNGSLEAHVTTVTRRSKRQAIKIGSPLWLRLNAARIAANLSWPEFLGRLLEGG